MSLLLWAIFVGTHARVGSLNLRITPLTLSVAPTPCGEISKQMARPIDQDPKQTQMGLICL